MTSKNRRRRGEGLPVPKPDGRTHVPETQPSEHPRSRVCYIDSIPDDVLFQILVELGLPEFMTPKMSTLLTSICKRWRFFVLNSPLLWTEITKPFPLLWKEINNPFGVKARYPDALNPFERSKPALINVVWDLSRYDNYTPEVTIANICDQIAQHSGRLQRLTITAITSINPRSSEIIFDRWRYPMPVLQALTIQVPLQKSCYRYDGNQYVPSMPLPLHWITGSSNLQTLRLHNVAIHHFPQLSISHLDINYFPTFESFKFISTKFPKLQTLIFRLSAKRIPTRPGITSISRTTLDDLTSDGNVFSRLRFLALYIQSPLTNNGCGDPDYALACLSTFMQSVEDVKIVCTNQIFEDSEQSEWSDFLDQWTKLPRLRRMKIKFSHSSLWGSIKFVNSLPHETLLEIDYPPEGSERALVNILSNNNLGGVIIVLAQPVSHWLPNRGPLTCSTFAAEIQSAKPILTCPTTIQLSQEQYPAISSTFSMLGPLLTIALKTSHTLGPRFSDTTSETISLRSSHMEPYNAIQYEPPHWFRRVTRMVKGRFALRQ